VTDDTRDGGETERLAPVIPLFGARESRTGADAAAPQEGAADAEAGHREMQAVAPVRRAPEARITRRPTTVRFVEDADDADIDDARSDRAEGARGYGAGDAGAYGADDTPVGDGAMDDAAEGRSDARRDVRAGDDAADSPAPDEIRADAEKTLLKKLRGRSLSVIEARRVLAECGLDRSAADDLIDDFLRRGYLDDTALAEQLVHTGADRKGQGRQVIGQTLAKRGVPREIADAVIAALPDDDAERALEFARTKARALDRVDEDTALRRLIGALSRRGYGGSVAGAAARAALSERSAYRAGGRPGGVRFR
jgi:regulatory protein